MELGKYLLQGRGIVNQYRRLEATWGYQIQKHTLNGLRVKTLSEISRGGCQRRAQEQFYIFAQSLRFHEFVKIGKHHCSSFRRRPESSYINGFRLVWTPVFTGVMTFYEAIEI